MVGTGGEGCDSGTVTMGKGNTEVRCDNGSGRKPSPRCSATPGARCEERVHILLQQMVLRQAYAPVRTLDTCINLRDYESRGVYHIKPPIANALMPEL